MRYRFRIAVAAVCLLAILSISLAGSSRAPELKYVLEIRFSDEYDSQDDTAGEYRRLSQGKLDDYLSFDSNSHMFYACTDGVSGEVTRPYRLIGQCSLSGDWDYTADGLVLSPGNGTGWLKLSLLFDELNTSGIGPSVRNEFIGGVEVAYRAQGWLTFGGGVVYPTLGSSVQVQNGGRLDTKSWTVETKAWLSSRYFVGNARSISVFGIVEGADGLEIGSGHIFGLEELVIRRLRIFVFRKVT